MPEIGFLHASFVVAGLAAAALPVVIHLLLRQRARHVDIGSVRFLRSVIRQHTRRRRIRQWLLLALRILALLLLGTLFARPFLDRAHLLGLNREVTFLMDTSASMQARSPRGGSLLHQAWQELQAEVDRSDRNTAIRIALFDAAGVTEIPVDNLSAEPSASDTATDYSAALSWARDVIALSSRSQRVLHLWTDLQQSGLRGHVEAFPQNVELVVHDVGHELTQNVAVDDVRATAVEIRPALPVTVAVRVYNSSPLPVDAIPISLRLNGPAGAVKGRQIVGIPGHGRKTVTFPLNVRSPGVYQGEAMIEHDDDLARDNRRYVAFEVRHPDRVLLVDGQPGRSVYTNETYFLEMALRLDVPTTDAYPRTYELERIVWEDGEGFPDLTGFRVIVLANLRHMTDNDLRRLRKYVAGGGRLMVFTGNQTTAAMIAEMQAAGLAPGSLAAVPESGLLRVTSWDISHPLLRPFADPQHGDLRRLSFRRMHRWEQLDPTARALINVANLPLLIEHHLDDGQVLWWGTSVDRDWSDWPQDRLFVPLLRQLMAYLTGQLTQQKSVQVAGLDDSHRTAGIDQSGSVTRVRNLDPRESSLARASEEDFRKALGLPTGDQQQPSETAAQVPIPQYAQRADEAWPLAMWFLLGILVAETLLASRVHA
jgi:hypothetical protein